jgi:hypothetical protein
VTPNPFGQRNDGGWCLCAVCGRRFGGLTGFDAHHVTVHDDGSAHGSRCNCSEWSHRCLTDTELSERGLFRDERGTWRQEGPFGARRLAQDRFSGAGKGDGRGKGVRALSGRARRS